MSTVGNEVHVPGLTRPPTIEELKKSRGLYNTLPNDTEQPPISDETRLAVGKIVARYGLLDHIGLHLVHGHIELPENHVLLGSRDGEYRWTPATPIDDINVNNVHGHVFVLTSCGFYPYEFQVAPPPDLSGVAVAAFLEELSSFLREQKLTRVVGLQLLDPNCRVSMLEFVFPTATLMAPVSRIGGCTTSVVTGWTFDNGMDGVRECKANEFHAVTSQGHLIFNEGAPTFRKAREFLRSHGLTH